MWPHSRRSGDFPGGLVARFLHVGILLGAAIPLCASPANHELDLAFRNEIRPLLDTYCSRCHGPELRTAGIAFSDFSDHASVVKSRSVWVRALRVLRENEMPPGGSSADRPRAADARRLDR